MTRVRLQKILAAGGIASRRRAEELLRAGRYRAYEGMTTGEFRPFAERPLPAK